MRAKIAVERDIYKRMYEELLERALPVGRVV